MFDSKISRIFIYIFAGIVSIFFTFSLIRSLNGLVPVWSDELFYYINALSFTENTTLRAAVTYTGKGSVLFQADAHGIGYPFLHGGIGKIFGFHLNTLPLTNFAVTLLAVVLIALRKDFDNIRKIALVACLLGCFTVILYTFTYMQEALQLLIAVAATLLLLDIYEHREPRKIGFFLALLLIAGLFRGLWLFWAVGLLPLARNKKEFFGWCVVAIGCALAAFLYLKLFHESFPGYFSLLIAHLKQGELNEAWRMMTAQIWGNLKIYFSGETSEPFPYYPYKLAILFATISGCFLAWRRSSPLYLGLSFIFLTNLLMLFICYQAGNWREIRTMSPLLYLFAVVVMAKREDALAAMVVVFVVGTFPFTARLGEERLSERVASAAMAPKNPQSSTLYQGLAQAAETVDDPLIYVGAMPTDFPYYFLYFPVKTRHGKQIRYAVNAFGENVNPLRYDFVLLKGSPPPFLQKTLPVFTDGALSLFRIPRPQ